MLDSQGALCAQALQLSHVTTSEQEEQELANGSAALDAAEAKLSARTGQTGQAYAGLQFVIREKTNAVWRDVKVGMLAHGLFLMCYRDIWAQAVMPRPVAFMPLIIASGWQAGPEPSRS